MAITDTVGNNNLQERMAYDGQIFKNFANAELITLVGSTDASNQHCTMAKVGDVSSGYQVPTGKQFRVLGIMSAPIDAGGNLGFQAATGAVGFRSNAAPSGSEFGSAAANLGAVASYTMTYFDHPMIIPAGKYIYCYMGFSSSGGTTSCVGIEEAIV